MNRLAGYCAIAASLVCLAAVLGFGSVLDGYSQVYHPLGLLGGKEIPNALAFNLFGFVIPGGLAAIAISSLRASLPSAAGWSMRIGVQLLVLSAIAFAAQGLVSIDPADLGAPGNRYHAVAWTLWWIAFVSGALLLAWSIRRYPQWRTQAWVSMGAAITVLAFALFAAGAIPSGISERIAFAAWFGWLLLVTRNSRPSALPT
ncbi:MAG: DUF998 domain-containing protein [Lysobacter sp.]|nr:DUF998 domain-containing protein [Lysobacter sp.]